MGIFNFNSNQSKKEQEIKKRMLLEFLTLDEMEKIWMQYVSRDKPKFTYTNNDGLSKDRAPKRQELIAALIVQVTIDAIIKVHPYLKKKLEEIEK